MYKRGNFKAVTYFTFERNGQWFIHFWNRGNVGPFASRDDAYTAANISEVTCPSS